MTKYPNAPAIPPNSPSSSWATGQVEDREPTPEEQGKDPAAVAMGKKGGASRAAKLSEAKRREIAKRAAQSGGKTAN